MASHNNVNLRIFGKGFSVNKLTSGDTQHMDGEGGGMLNFHLQPAAIFYSVKCDRRPALLLH
jgi:hypothetical protein